MKVLVTGANGLVGRVLVKALTLAGYEVIATGKGPSRLGFEHNILRWYDADITHPFQLRSIMEAEKPEVVIHGAAMTQVDECEQRQKEAHSLNVEATARLLLDAEEFSSFFIFLSTDFVFDGERGMYSEEDDVNPISWYGQTKVEAEAVVQTSTIPWAIVRTCLVYGAKPEGGRANLYSWIRESLEAGKAIKVVDDQWRTPTLVDDLVNGILLLVEQRKEGIWHLSGQDQLTPYRFALKLAEAYGLDSGLLEKVTADNFSQPGRRPLLTGFNIDKASMELGYKPRSIDEAFEYLRQ